MSTSRTAKEGRIIHPYELKAVEFSEAMSDETNCFSANIYDGKKLVATAMNRGHGGPTDVHFVSDEARNEIEDYCNSLPVRDVRNFGDERGDIEYRWDAECLADDLFERWHEAKQDKKYYAGIKRDAKTKLLVAIGDQDPFDPTSGYSFYKKFTYGRMFRHNDVLVPVQDIMRERLSSEGAENIRFYNPETEEWV